MSRLEQGGMAAAARRQFRLRFRRGGVVWPHRPQPMRGQDRGPRPADVAMGPGRSSDSAMVAYA